jgi:hypothetical protein
MRFGETDLLAAREPSEESNVEFRLDGATGKYLLFSM